MKIDSDGLPETQISRTLTGSYWKEKGTATVPRGMGSLMGKLQDK